MASEEKLWLLCANAKTGRASSLSVWPSDIDLHSFSPQLWCWSSYSPHQTEGVFFYISLGGLCPYACQTCVCVSVCLHFKLGPGSYLSSYYNQTWRLCCCLLHLRCQLYFLKRGKLLCCSSKRCPPQLFLTLNNFFSPSFWIIFIGEQLST